ncbi:peptide chain release factor N(5)-glutamine methyltransferase [Bacillus sp. 37MA]|uniref:peptide chain release factor N(5)-glutamine methyltransferase n=1 Tax=Bacillus sp. 37MA TaxID=1132442 RepID=UPI000382E6A7|nr:peptide chain release factor N(5)-glutamine methyltransferase [Bacillus sp. 37MA]
MTKKMYEALNWASSYLTHHERDANAGEYIMKHILQVERSQMLARLHDVLSEEQTKEFERLVHLHAEGVPVQHMTGTEEFYGRIFSVNGDVLIPRPETEELVYYALEKIKDMKSPVIADIGTGSGAIAITMKCERPEANVYAIDLSKAALKIAENNANKLGVPIQYLHGDLLEPLIQRNIKVDLLLSNPPYIPNHERETLSAVVVDHEPHMALFGGEDGLDLYRKITQQLPFVLKVGGIAGVETGAGQTEAVAAMFQETFPDRDVKIMYDINGKDRMVFLHV